MSERIIDRPAADVAERREEALPRRVRRQGDPRATGPAPCYNRTANCAGPVERYRMLGGRIRYLCRWHGADAGYRRLADEVGT